MPEEHINILGISSRTKARRRKIIMVNKMLVMLIELKDLKIKDLESVPKKLYKKALAFTEEIHSQAHGNAPNRKIMETLKFEIDTDEPEESVEESEEESEPIEEAKN